jgi:hypothetical protein
MSYVEMAMAVVSAVATVYSSNAQSAELESQANTADANAKLERQKTNAAEEAQRRRMALLRGKERAAAAESGFDPSSGSLALMQIKSAGEMELDALTKRYEGTLKSMSYENEAASLKAQASSSRRSGYVSAAATLIGGAGSSYFSGTKVSSTDYRGTTLPDSLRGQNNYG